MKKTIAILLAMVLCVSMFAACGESKAETKTETKSEAAAPAATEQKSEAAAPAASEKSEAAAPAAPSGETYNLVVVNHDASTSMCEKYVETLCNMMSEDSGGRLQFQFNPGGSLLGATETIDGVKDGTADICWSCTSFFGSRFPISEFINLCANGITSGRMGTDVFQEMYEEIPEVQAEFKDWKVLALHACTFAPVSTVGKKIETKDDFKGLQLRAAGTVASQYLTALGATPISMPTSDVYESVEKKVIDGFCNDWHNIDCFKLYEPIDYCLNLPINFTSCFVLMNKDTYEGLPEDLQAIIDKYANGYAGDMAGYWWDSCRYWVADKMAENNVEVYEPSEELLSWAQSEEVVGPIHEWYVGYLNDAGLDGQAIFDKCMEIVEKNKAAHADDWAAPYSYEDWNETP